MERSVSVKACRREVFLEQYKTQEEKRERRNKYFTVRQFISAIRQSRKENPNVAPVVPLNAFQEAAPRILDVFSNSVILETLANHLPFQSLLNCRLVCKLWDKEMYQLIMKCRVLVVTNADCAEARDLVRKKEQGTFITISTLCIMEIPITSQIITDVIRNFGRTLSVLKLDFCKLEIKDLVNLLKSISSFEVLSFKELGFRSRKLRRAVYDNSIESDSDDEENEGVHSICDTISTCFPSLIMPTVKNLNWEEKRPIQFLERMFKTFPCLKELNLLYWSKPDPERMKGLRIDNLEQLTISCDNNFSEHHFIEMANLKLKLKRLLVHDIDSGNIGNTKGLEIFLTSLATTLEELHLSGSGGLEMMDLEANVNYKLLNNSKIFVWQNTPFQIEFPQLLKLEIDCSLLTDLKTLGHMPKLCKLECQFPDWKSWWDVLNRNGVPKQQHTALKAVTLGAIDTGCLLKIIPLFPGVLKLNVSEDRIDDIAFRIICEQMTQLRHLTISESANSKAKQLVMSDTGFTGIPREYLEELKDALPHKVQEHLEKKRKTAYIGHLKALDNLKLLMTRVELSDLGILYGIAELSHISFITLPRCGLTDTSLAAFAEMPNLLILQLHNTSAITEKAVNAFKASKKDTVFNTYSDEPTQIFF